MSLYTTTETYRNFTITKDSCRDMYSIYGKLGDMKIKKIAIKSVAEAKEIIDSLLGNNKKGTK